MHGSLTVNSDRMDKLKIDKSWTLFLDRDGVINRRKPNSYIRFTSEFEFLPGVKETLASFSRMFRHIIVVTNQQGIAKGYLTTEQLERVHDYMIGEITAAGGCIDGVYYCGDAANMAGNCRKPSPVLAYRAQADFHDIQFSRALMVGDSISDILFGHRLGMKTILVGERLGVDQNIVECSPDFVLPDLSSVESVILE